MESDLKYDLVGIGVGPFNLSLAALMNPVKELKAKFLDDKPSFLWHPELMFDDAMMQTSYLKDLVTPIDPTSQFSFLNYLVHKGQLYHFLNTDRKVVSRVEFQDYCAWVAKSLGETLEFNQRVREVHFDGESFTIQTDTNKTKSQHLCIASGPVRNIPDCAKSFLGVDVFHAKSKEMAKAQLEGKRVLIVGGGQTGVEVFTNILKGRRGRVENLCLISGRENLVSLEESPFTNDVFTPDFVDNFHSLPQDRKDKYTTQLLFASDGNTPDYLNELYRSLYMDRYYHRNYAPYQICPMRWMNDMSRGDNGFTVKIENLLSGQEERWDFDVIILATGFRTKLPEYLDGIVDEIEKDDLGRPHICKDYKLKWAHKDNTIYAMNYSRHMHGIADPQTSLMSWRSSIIINSLLKEERYRSQVEIDSFLSFFSH